MLRNLPIEAASVVRSVGTLRSQGCAGSFRIGPRKNVSRIDKVQIVKEFCEAYSISQGTIQMLIIMLGGAREFSSAYCSSTEPLRRSGSLRRRCLTPEVRVHLLSLGVLV